MKWLSSSEEVIQTLKIGGFIFDRLTNSTIPNPADSTIIFSPISEGFDTALFGVDEGNDEIRPGSTTSLKGMKKAFPCVCEVPPSMAPLFSKEGAKVVSQGITWQSLYLTVEGENLVLVEPERRSNGKGRVVTRFRLENLTLDKDPDDARVDTAARRLIMIYESPDLKPPGMFRFEKKPEPKNTGMFSHISLRCKSTQRLYAPIETG